MVVCAPSLGVLMSSRNGWYRILFHKASLGQKCLPSSVWMIPGCRLYTVTPVPVGGREQTNKHTGKCHPCLTLGERAILEPLRANQRKNRRKNAK